MVSIDELKKVLKINEPNGNYPTMCNKLNEPRRKGGPKVLQQKEWKRFINYYKKGHQFIVTEIYDIELEKVDKRQVGNNAIFKEGQLEGLLIRFLKQNEQSEGVVVVTKDNLYEQLALVPKGYKKQHLKLEDVKGGIQRLTYERARNDFRKKVKEILSTCITTELNRLKRKGLIDFIESRVKTIRKTETGIEKHYLCSDEELETILKVESQLCKTKGYLNTHEVQRASTKARFDFYNELQDILNTKHNIGYTRCYRAYKISLKDGFYDFDYPTLKSEEVQDKQLEVNQIFMERVKYNNCSKLDKINKKDSEYEEYQKWFIENNGMSVERNGSKVRLLGRPIQTFTEFQVTSDEQTTKSEEYQKQYSTLVESLRLSQEDIASIASNKKEKIIIPKKSFKPKGR